MNNVALSGYLGQDPEILIGSTGKDFCKFSLAVRREFAREGQQNTDWFTVVVFGKDVDFVTAYIKKGTAVEVTGRIENRTYTTREGVERMVSEIIANSVKFSPGGKPAEKETGPSASVRGRTNAAAAKKRQSIPAATPEEVAAHIYQETGEIIEPDDLPF